MELSRKRIDLYKKHGVKLIEYFRDSNLTYYEAVQLLAMMIEFISDQVLKEDKKG